MSEDEVSFSGLEERGHQGSRGHGRQSSLL